MPIDAVTGARSYTGRFIAAELGRRGREVVNLTRHPSLAHAAGDDSTVVGSEIRFPAASSNDLAHALEGIDTLYNTHWIRFERGQRTYARAISETELLLEAAREARVRRVVHVSVVHPSRDAPTAYFRAKAQAEDLVRLLSPSHAVVRPTVTFGPGDILVNNLAWTLRRIPAFGFAGDGRYPIQPVHVEDIARIAVDVGGAATNQLVDAAGPERLTFREFVRLVRAAVGSHAVVLPLPVDLALMAARALGLIVRDVVLTSDEVTELQAGLMVSDEPALGRIRFSDWVRENGATLGRHWSSELDRHYRVPGDGAPW